MFVLVYCPSSMLTSNNTKVYLVKCNKNYYQYMNESYNDFAYINNHIHRSLRLDPLQDDPSIFYPVDDDIIIITTFTSKS